MHKKKVLFVAGDDGISDGIQQIFFCSVIGTNISADELLIHWRIVHPLLLLLLLLRQGDDIGGTNIYFISLFYSEMLSEAQSVY